MPLRYLLDTSIISNLVREPHGRVASRITAAGEDTVCTSIVVASELRYGALKSDSSALMDRIDLLLRVMEVMPLEAPVDQHYAAVRHTLTRRGTLIGPNDLLIASHAMALNLTLVTANQREFRRVPGLRVENWLARARR